MPPRFHLPAAALLIFLAAPAAQAAEPDVDFGRDIRPILANHCFACHGPDAASRQADLRLDVRESAVTSVIVPGMPDESPLVARITSADAEQVMPPPETKKPLNDEQRALLRRWIEAGAEYRTHWSLAPLPAAVPPPTPNDPAAWIRNGVDAFVLDGLRNAGHMPADESPRERWLRRVTFDLTGLPPTLEELDRFAADATPDAYEQVVERLLHSPAYAERMTNDWLDVARYADTFGYQTDRDTHLWPWRDWVIRAFAQNLPYDDFIVWQIAGDLLPEPSRDQLLATAFNRLHRQTAEGGSIVEEFRVEYVADRIRTMGTAFLGLTLECARCHDHKYDPVTQREYYGLAAFFDKIDEHGLYSHFTETAPTPALPLYDGDQEARHIDLLVQIRGMEAELAAMMEAVVAAIDPAIAPAGTAAQSSAEAIATPAPNWSYTFDDTPAAGDYRPVAGRNGQALEFGGDDAFVCQDVPQFGRTSQFSLSLWVKPAAHGPRMMVAHQCVAAEDAAFRGFSLVLDQGTPVVSLVHFWPGNALQIRGNAAIAVGEWTHLAVTYDGGSRAAGLRLYVNGAAAATESVRDRLTRDIVQRAEWGDYNVGTVRFSLGARFRDSGFRGGAIDDVAVFDRPLTALEIASLDGRAIPPGGADLAAHSLARSDPDYQRIAAELLALRQQENDLIGGVPQIMVMRESSEVRTTHILARGAYDAPGEAVEAGTPAGIFPLPEEFPRNRLGLAQWLVDDRNPLTARVIVNRTWQTFFGRGLVQTAEDFGSQGESPSHPELLDWLARRFVDGGWDVHDLCRTIALSATYRQDSTPRDPRLFEIDPENRLLARGPRHRLAAEQLRDNALAASGLLVSTTGGPSVFPYQPAGLWEEAGTGKTYPEVHGDALYRRSMYTFWRRTSPPPTMTAFDAPSREFCLARRDRTTTPLQALALLNDPQFVEAARVLAEKLIVRHGDDLDGRVVTAFRSLTSRMPSAGELAVLRRLYERQHAHFAAHLPEAAEYVATGEAPRNMQLDPADHAATTALVQALMNFDECVTKR